MPAMRQTLCHSLCLFLLFFSAPAQAWGPLGHRMVAETAALLDVSEATVLRDWRAAKAWLARELRQQS